jgi:putative ABC transport system permease protein
MTVPASCEPLCTAYQTLAEVKHGSQKTNPNVDIRGANEEFIPIKGLNIQDGRNFSRFEVQRGSKVAVIGYKLAVSLYGQNPMPVGTDDFI